MDGSGNVYVADYGNHRIQKFTSGGTYMTQWGTLGTGNGQFQSLGVAVDGSGNVYVADSYNNRIQKFTSSGTYLTQWGTSRQRERAVLRPYGVAVDGSGNVYVADTGNNRIQKFTSGGTYLTQWGTHGSGHGQFNARRRGGGRQRQRLRGGHLQQPHPEVHQQRHLPDAVGHVRQRRRAVQLPAGVAVDGAATSTWRTLQQPHPGVQPRRCPRVHDLGPAQGAVP